ncbi:MFS transporter [Ectobacillus panaciterrae]|uniref:MFS transporter n=1 Tax=Ectobacillus panaciterrae TaxID=363872 RepID=UPI00048B1311|nr:MFS transporter [Ectobacillus panaciterrae]
MTQANLSPSFSNRFALQSRSFRIFLYGSLVARIGDWMDLVALNWAVLTITDSPIALGIINACRLLPAFLFSVPAGVMADRYDRRKLLIWIQFGMMLLTFCLAYAVENKWSLYAFIAIVVLRSVLAAMDPPVRNAFVTNLVSGHKMKSAVALNTTSMNLSRIIGPAAAGLLLMKMEVSQLFWLNGCSTAAALMSFFLVHSHDDYAKRERSCGKVTIREAIVYVRENSLVSSLLLLAVVPMLFGFPYTALLPLFGKDILRLGAEGFGLLLSVSAVGAVLGSGFLSTGKEIRKPGRWLMISIMAFGSFLLLFMFSNHVIAASIIMFFVGFASQLYRTLSRLTIQLYVPDRLRGRVLSIALMDRGFIPLGALLIGMLADWTSSFWAGIFMGISCIVFTLLVGVKYRQIWHL